MKEEIRKAWEIIADDVLNQIYAELKKSTSLNYMKSFDKHENCITILLKYKDLENTIKIYTKLGDITHVIIEYLDKEYKEYNCFGNVCKWIISDIIRIHETFERDAVNSEKIEPIVFKMTELETSRANDFYKKHKKCRGRSTEGTSCILYKFRPSAIGDFVTVECTRCGETLNITDDNF